MGGVKAAARWCDDFLGPVVREARWRVRLSRRSDRWAHAVYRTRIDVPIESCFLGGMWHLSGMIYGEAIGDPSWPETHLIDGPHADLYKRIASGESLIDATGKPEPVPYVDMGLACIASFGAFNSAKDLSGMAQVIEMRRELFVTGKDRIDSDHLRPIVRRISGTDLFEVVDGHHRLAAAWVRGDTHACVDLVWSLAERRPGFDRR